MLAQVLGQRLGASSWRCAKLQLLLPIMMLVMMMVRTGRRCWTIARILGRAAQVDRVLAVLLLLVEFLVELAPNGVCPVRGW